MNADFNPLRVPTISADQRLTLAAAITQFGMDRQADMAIEEMSELTKALLKYRRGRRRPDTLQQLKADIGEETADVIIMLTQLVMIYGNSEQVQQQIDYKIDRLSHRLLWPDKEAGKAADQDVLQSAT